jgi:hypothetical protein
VRSAGSSRIFIPRAKAGWYGMIFWGVGLSALLVAVLLETARLMVSR